MVDTETERRYLWDFFGPAAERTATHFLKHLGEFLEAEHLVGLTCGTESAQLNHQAVFCVASGAQARLIEQRLRPNRVLGVVE